MAAPVVVWFERCDELANGVQELLEVSVSPVDLSGLQRF